MASIIIISIYDLYMHLLECMYLVIPTWQFDYVKVGEIMLLTHMCFTNGTVISKILALYHVCDLDQSHLCHQLKGKHFYSSSPP